MPFLILKHFQEEFPGFPHGTASWRSKAIIQFLEQYFLSQRGSGKSLPCVKTFHVILFGKHRGCDSGSFFVIGLLNMKNFTTIVS